MKLRLPHKFQAALMAALASVSFTTLSTGTLGVATGAALLAGQKAMAVSLDDAVLQTENITSTITVDNWTANQMSVAIELDMAAFKECLTSTWIAGTATVTTIFNVEGTWNSATGGRTDTEGLNINGSSKQQYGTPYAQATSPNGSSSALRLDNNLSESLKFTTSTNWNDYKAMSVVLTFNGGSEVTATWYIKNADGTTSTYYGAHTGVKWGGSTAFTPDGTIKNIDTSMVNYMAVFDSKLSQADSATIASAVLTRTPSGYGMEFSGDVFTIEHTTNQTFHNATFSSWYQDENGQWKKGSHTWGGGSTTYYVGEEERTVAGGSFWRSLFGDGQGGYTARLGNTIRLTGATGNVYYESQFSPYQLGGIIVEEGNSGTYVLGRNGATVIHLKAREGKQANMYVASNLGLSTNAANGIDIESSGTWKVFEGKSLTFGFYSSATSLANNGSITFKNGVTVSMVGGGTVDMTHTNNLTIESGATVEVGENTLAKFANGTTLNGTVNNAGTATFNGLTRGNGSLLTNTGTLTLDGTITFGGSAITNNATGTVGFGDNVKFNLDTLTATGSDADGWTFTLFSGTGTGVDLSGFDVTNIIMTTRGGTAGKNWDFSTLNQISYTVKSEKVWDVGVGNWNYTDPNWTGQKFEQGDIAVFNNNAIVTVQGAVAAGGITVTGSNVAMVDISAGTDASLTAGTVRVDANNNLVTGIAIEGLQDFNVAGNWTIAADQALGAGTINGGVLTISTDKTATLTNAGNSATLLRDIAGGGNIKLTQDTFFEGSTTAAAAPTTQARGTLFVDGVTLSIGSMNTGPYNHTYVNMSSFEHVQLDNGTLYIHNDAFDLNGLTVNSGKTGTVHIYDTASVGYNTLNLKGTTKVDGTLTFTGDWKQTFTIEALTGTGEVKFEGLSHNEGAAKGQIANLQGGTIGKLTIDGNNAATAIVNVNGGLTVTNGMTINKGALNISDTLTLSGGVSTISSAINGTGSLVVDSGATLKLGGAGLINVGTLTMNSGSFMDVSNITQMAGLTVNLASYTNSATCTDANITGVNSSLTYTLNTADNNVTLTFASKPQPTPTPVADLGKVMYVGDSITDGVAGGGVNAKSWRYSFFQVLADGGISQVEEGYYQHTQSSGAITTTTYGGRTFENIHSAKASARSWETAGVPTSQKGGDRYDYTSIQNWLGQRETKRNGTAYPTDKPRYSGDDAPNTYFMLLGTNDLLSEGGNHIGESHFNSVLSSMFGYSGGSFDGQSGTFDIIWKSMTDERSDAKLIVLEMPTWSPNHGNHQDASDFAYLTKFNQKLHEWADSKANKAQITIVNPNPGIVDVANTTKPGSGVPTMFIDGLHPSAQGELLMAGNIAKQLGYAGRSVGLDRAAYTAGSTEWHTAGAEPITVVAGDPAQTIGTATGAFTARDGYTIDFSAVYGNGIAGGWSDAAGNALSIMVGDGSHTGTLTLSEAYVMWGDTVLYSRDNHVTGDNFRIAYVNASITPSDNVNTGYYVWMGDQLIGEALDATTGSSLLNGIQLSATGASSSVTGTVTGLTWADKAYAPTTNLYENPDSSKLFHLVQGYISTEPHDNPEKQGIQTVSWEPTTDYYTLPSGSSQASTLYKEISTTIGSNYTGAAHANYTGNIGMHYTGTENLDAKQSILSVWNATVTGDVYILLDNPNTVYDSFTSQAGQYTSMVATWGGNITGKYTATINAGILPYNVYGGAHTGDNSYINGGSYIYINGGQFGENVYGGGRVASATINKGTYVTVTGGAISGSVYGGGVDGTINGGTHVTITGGIITGDVNGGGTGGTINGGTNVTIVGNLPYIQGNISADNVLLQGVSPNDEGYTDFFDAYRGTITGTETITLDNYTVDHLYAALVTKTLVLSSESITTIHNLTLTACTITAQAGTQVTLADSLTLGNTANFSGDVSFAEEGIAIDVSALMQDSPGDRITLFSGAEGSKLGGLSDLSLISVTGSGSEDYHLAVGNEGQYLYLDRNTAALIPWHEPSENVIGYQGLNQTASGTYVAGDDVQEIPGHTGTGVYTSVTSGTNVSALYANQGDHTGDVYMLVNGVTMVNKSGAYGWIAAHNSGMLTGNASVKVENTNNAPAMLFGVVGGNVTGNVYTEVDDGTFASFTTKEAKASYAGSYQGNITGEARLVTAGGTFEYDVYGGVHTNVDQGTNSIGSTKLDLRGGAFKGNVYGGGLTGSVTGGTNVIVSGTAEVDGSVYGGGNGGTVGGSTNVTISGDDAQVKGNVYGNTAATQGGTVTLKDRTNGFGDGSHVIVTEALNLQNTQGAVSSQITAETVNLTDSSTVTINNLTLTPTSDTDTCALTMATGSALTLDGTLSLSKAANYSGSLALTDGMTLDLSRMNLSGMEESVTLLNSSSGNLGYTDLNTIQINAPSATYEAYNLSVDTNNNLVLTFVQSTAGLIWDGSANDRWSNQITDTNWHKVDKSPGSDYFTATSDVVFEQGESATIVDISENISAGTVLLRSGADVTLHTDPQVARTLNVDRLSVASGADLMLVANVDMTTATMVGAGTVTVENGASLHLTDGVVNTGTTLVVNGGGVLELAGTGDDLLAVQNLNLGYGAVLDLSNIQFAQGSKSVKIADIDGRLDLPSRNAVSFGAGTYIDLISICNYQGASTDGTDVVYLAFTGEQHREDYDAKTGIYYYTDAALYLVKEERGLYWNNRDGQGNLVGGVWLAKQEDYSETGEANWNQKLTSKTSEYPNTTTNVDAPLYFITESPDEEITVQVAQAYSDLTKDLADMRAATIVIGGGGTFNFERISEGDYSIRMNPNVPSSLIVRENTKAHFDMNVSVGEFGSVLVEQGGQLDIFDENYGEGGLRTVYVKANGKLNLSVPGMDDYQVMVNEGNANIGYVWDEQGNLCVDGIRYIGASLLLGSISNLPGATLTIAGDSVTHTFSTQTPLIANEGKLVFRADDLAYEEGLHEQVSVYGMGEVYTVGNQSVYFENYEDYEGEIQDTTVDGSLLNTGAKLTSFGNRVTITNTTTLTAEDFAEDEDKRSTTTFNYTSQLGEHVVMGGNTTLDLNTGSQANPVYTMGEVTSTGDDQVMIVRSGVTANVADGVSLPDGKAQVAGGGKLTIGGATSTVGELAATGDGTAVAVVELNGSNANEDPVLNAKKLSNENGTTLCVLNTDTENDRTAKFNIGDEASASSSNYSGALQYGVGADAASGSGMNLTIKDNNVADGAVLEAYYDADAPQSAPVNVVVDTDAAKVVGLSDNISGPDPDRSMSVSGSGYNTAETGNNGLEITGNDDYEYAGKLGAKLDIAYTGDGSQTIQGGVSNFEGAVTVDNDTTEEGVLAILNASSVSITDLTIGANDKLNVKKGDQGSQADGMTTVTGTLTARGGSGNASKLDSDLTMGGTSTLDVSAAGGQGGLDLLGTLTITKGAVSLSGDDWAAVGQLGWYGMYDLAFDVTGLNGFGDVADWSQGVDATTVFANTGLNKDEYYVRYSGAGMGGNGNNVGAVYIYRIPEPTTSTLSLLALAALAARRRRKG